MHFVPTSPSLLSFLLALSAVCLVHPLSPSPSLSTARRIPPLQLGVGLQFPRVLWYHFPKTGGTSMRLLLHGYCRQASMNLSSHYGVEDECGIPFSCHSRPGAKTHFTYGHVSDDFATYSSGERKRGTSRTLFVFMIREPFSWLLSRHQHSIRKLQAGVDLTSLSRKQRQRLVHSMPSLRDTAREHGNKYFNFLPPREREMARGQFSRALEGGTAGQGSVDAPAELGAALDDLLSPPGGETEPLVLVLVTEHFAESLQLLDHVFATSLFTAPTLPSYNSNSSSSSSSSSSKVLPQRNRALPWQESAALTSSPGELKELSLLLRGHQALYHAALQRFLVLWQQRVHQSPAARQ